MSEKESLSLSDLGLEEEVTPAQAAETTNIPIQDGVVNDTQNHNQIEVKKSNVDMSEFPTGPKRKIPRPDNIQTIDNQQSQSTSNKGDLKVEHSTDANAGYSTVDINSIAKTHHKKKPEDAAKKTLKNLAEQTEAGIQRTKNDLTAPGGRIEEGKRKYVHDRYNTLMGRAQQSPNLMKKIKTFQEIMETDSAFDGADEYERKAYILFKVAKDTSIGIDDKSFGLAQESLRKIRQSSADTSKVIDKMTRQSKGDEFDTDDRVVFDEDDGIPTVKREIKKQEESKVLEEKLEKAKEELVEKKEESKPISTLIKDPVKSDIEDDDLFDDEQTVPVDQEENLIKLKDTKDDDFDDDEQPINSTDKANADLANSFGITVEKFNEIQKAYVTQARELLHLNSSAEDVSEYNNFNTSSRAITMNEALRIAKRSRPQHLVARWALQYTGIPIRMTSFSGEELVQFLSDIETGYNQARTGNLPSIDQLTSIWGTIYNHVEMENKPNFNTWLRRISANDFANFIFAIYMAIFKDTNYLTYRCPKKGCAKLYLEKHDVMEMIKFPNEQVENRIKTILDGGEVKSMVYRTEPIPINETFAMSFITPSVYSFNFEQAALPYSYRQEHSISGLMMAIDKVYIIDRARNQFLPIEFGVVKDDLEKTVKRKIRDLERIFSTFTLDQRNLILAEYQKITETLETEQIQYKLPKSTCPVCGTEIPEEESNSFTLLFTRARLSIDAASTRE